MVPTKKENVILIPYFYYKGNIFWGEGGNHNVIVAYDLPNLMTVISPLLQILRLFLDGQVRGVILKNTAHIFNRTGENSFGRISCSPFLSESDLKMLCFYQTKRNGNQDQN